MALLDLGDAALVDLVRDLSSAYGRPANHDPSAPVRVVATALNAGLAPIAVEAALARLAATGLADHDLASLFADACAVAGLPRGPAERDVVLSDHVTAMIEAGASDTPIVIVHSLGLDWRMSHSIVLALADHARVVAYDLRLHGRAIGSPTACFTLARCADDLSDLLDVLGCRTAHVVGFSLGGAVAQLFALTHSARVASLALVCTMARAPRALYLDRARNAREHGMEAQLVETLLRWFGVEELAKNTPAVRYARAKVLGVSVDHWSQYWRALAEADTVTNLRSLGRFPTSVIAAERDKSTPPASMRQIADEIPGAHFETIPAAPHMVSLECPAQTTHALLEHLYRARNAQREQDG